jgi:NADPH:quinone reductase-like Zn-dependent oxidoreductase
MKLGLLTGQIRARATDLIGRAKTDGQNQTQAARTEELLARVKDVGGENWVAEAARTNKMIPLGELGKRADAFPVWSVGVESPGKMALFGYEEDAEIKDNEVRVATLFSGWSAGTEGTILSGHDARTTEAFDPDAGLFRKSGAADHGIAYPRPFTGYMEVGIVIDSKREGMEKGEIICGTWGHKTAHTYGASDKNFIRLPATIDPAVGILVAQMGPICANGLAHADRALRFEMTDAEIAKRHLSRTLARLTRHEIEEPGRELKDRNAVVFGAGIVGLVTAMMAKAAGANVAITDVDEGRLERARQLGLTPINVSDPKFDLGKYVKDELGWKTKRGKPGADVAFQCTARDEALHSAMRCVGRQQPVIDMGYYVGGAPNLYLGKEFHHLGLLHVCAQVENLLKDWPKPKLREYTVRFLEKNGDDIKKHVITDEVPYAKAAEFITTLRERPDTFQVALKP